MHYINEMLLYIYIITRSFAQWGSVFSINCTTTFCFVSQIYSVPKTTTVCKEQDRKKQNVPVNF